MKGTDEQLEFEAEFLEGVIRRNSTHVDCLKVLAENYTLSGRHRDGLRMDLRLARLCPRDAVVYYNLACSYSLTGRLKRAEKALSYALSLGYRDFDHMKRDPDLAALRETGRFDSVIGRQCAG